MASYMFFRRGFFLPFAFFWSAPLEFLPERSPSSAAKPSLEASIPKDPRVDREPKVWLELCLSDEGVPLWPPVGWRGLPEAENVLIGGRMALLAGVFLIPVEEVSAAEADVFLLNERVLLRLLRPGGAWGCAGAVGGSDGASPSGTGSKMDGRPFASMRV